MFASQAGYCKRRVGQLSPSEVDTGKSLRASPCCLRALRKGLASYPQREYQLSEHSISQPSYRGRINFLRKSGPGHSWTERDSPEVHGGELLDAFRAIQITSQRARICSIRLALRFCILAQPRRMTMSAPRFVSSRLQTACAGILYSTPADSSHTSVVEGKWIRINSRKMRWANHTQMVLLFASASPKLLKGLRRHHFASIERSLLKRKVPFRLGRVETYCRNLSMEPTQPV